MRMYNASANFNPIQPLVVDAGQSINPGDFVKLVAGNLQRCADNDSGCIGRVLGAGEAGDLLDVAIGYEPVSYEIAAAAAKTVSAAWLGETYAVISENGAHKLSSAGSNKLFVVREVLDAAGKLLKVGIVRASFKL